MCGNELDDNQLAPNTKVTGASRIRVSDLFGVTEA